MKKKRVEKAKTERIKMEVGGAKAADMGSSSIIGSSQLMAISITPKLL